MLRIIYAMGGAVALLLQISSSFAAEGNNPVTAAPNAESISVATSDKIYQTAASTFQGEGDQLARRDAALQQPATQSKPASKGVAMEYPALALLAMAIISMAALSRRDSFRIDR